jgi:hypothetical protein
MIDRNDHLLGREMHFTEVDSIPLNIPAVSNPSSTRQTRNIHAQTGCFVRIVTMSAQKCSAKGAAKNEKTF